MLLTQKETWQRQFDEDLLGMPSDSPSCSTRGEKGIRPITLIGYGMGARVIFHCLEYLAEVGGEAGKGIVENVLLIGAPIAN